MRNTGRRVAQSDRRHTGRVLNAGDEDTGQRDRAPVSAVCLGYPTQSGVKTQHPQQPLEQAACSVHGGCHQPEGADRPGGRQSCGRETHIRTVPGALWGCPPHVKPQWPWETGARRETCAQETRTRQRLRARGDGSDAPHTWAARRRTGTGGCEGKRRFRAPADAVGPSASARGRAREWPQRLGGAGSQSRNDGQLGAHGRRSTLSAPHRRGLPRALWKSAF